MLETLKFRRAYPIHEYRETKGGTFQYSGDTLNYAEWEFRTKARLAGCKADDLPNLASKIIEGLRDRALKVAMNVGNEKLAKPDGVKLLIEAMKQHVFPYRREEAKQLYKMGHETTGHLCRQSTEQMTEYCDRRRRWYESLLELNDGMTLSDDIRANLLLECSGLSRSDQRQVIIQASADERPVPARSEEEAKGFEGTPESTTEFDRIAAALQKLHPDMSYEKGK